MAPDRLDEGDEERDLLANLLKSEAEKEPVGVSEVHNTAQEQGWDLSRDQVDHLMNNLAEEGELESKKFGNSRTAPKVFYTSTHTSSSTEKDTYDIDLTD